MGAAAKVVTAAAANICPYELSMSTPFLVVCIEMMVSVYGTYEGESNKEKRKTAH